MAKRQSTENCRLAKNHAHCPRAPWWGGRVHYVGERRGRRADRGAVTRDCPASGRTARGCGRSEASVDSGLRRNVDRAPEGRGPAHDRHGIEGGGWRPVMGRRAGDRSTSIRLCGGRQKPSDFPSIAAMLGAAARPALAASSTTFLVASAGKLLIWSISLAFTVSGSRDSLTASVRRAFSESS